MRQQRQEISELNIGTAYILWALSCLGCCGIHRFYLGRYFSGLIYLFTFGLFGLGQFIDLFFIPSMTRERNHYLWSKSRIEDNRYFMNLEEGVLRNQSIKSFKQKQKKYHSPEIPKQETAPLVKLLKAAAAHNNTLSLGQAVIILELPIEEVKELLNKAVKQDLAHVDNDLKTGAVRYHFDI